MPIQVKWFISFVVGGALVYVGWKWLAVLYTLHVMLCILLILVVLLQSGKAADLAGAFGGAGSQTAFGPRGAANFLTRATTWCAVMFMVTSMTLVMRRNIMQPDAGSGSVLGEQQPAQPEQAPAAPAPAPTNPATGEPVPATAPPSGTQPASGTPAIGAPAPPPAQPPAKQPAKNPPAKQ